MLKITGGTGFQITFDNGITISVQFGRGNYCEHKMSRLPFGSFIDIHESNTAEIALFDHNGEWITRQAALAVTGEDICDDVLGWQNTEQVWKFMAWAQAQPKPNLKTLEYKTPMDVLNATFIHDAEIVDN